MLLIRRKDMANARERLNNALTFAQQRSVTYGDLPARKCFGRKAKVWREQQLRRPRRVPGVKIPRDHHLGLSLKRARAEAGCEACSWTLGPEHWRTLHAHHVIPLSCGGEDTNENMVVLCPNHHAVAHARWRRDYNRWTGPRNRAQLLVALET